ncbi:hypothetical protein SAMN05444166_5275 [Singulisphaera sp. GP187]|uniref:hypothetical protein n=1 Tax=Singulisphaera sp. GP187 TaxID=1882752 RepID=UPI000927FF26|nr:hypothetical protein [Singulisphaera sp. GP187]SIO56667.1 hypothetical protein SAMN05444166_5275 [Singulisphaera sp. GP187]
MARPKGQKSDGAGLVFAAYNTHHERCGAPPGLRNTDTPRLYHGYFENRYSEQFVLTFDRTTKTGTVSSGDLNWANPISFTLGLVEEALQATQQIAAQIVDSGPTEPPNLPLIDAALALGRLTGLTGKDEVIWLRACLEACDALPHNQRSA